MFTWQSRELPEGLPFVAYALPKLVRTPTVLLAPGFESYCTDDAGETYSPLPYMLSLEGWDHLDGGVASLGHVGRSAMARGWCLRRLDGDAVEIGRPGKTLFRGPLVSLAGQLTGQQWRRSVAESRHALVLVSEVEIPPPTTLGRALKAAGDVSGSHTGLPAVGF